MGQPVTTNPFMIALINMTVVFGVLYGLSLLIKLIRLIDPTQKKTARVENAAQPAAPVQEETVAVQDDAEIVAVIAAAISAYGYGSSQIASIRRTADGKSWAQAARIEAVTARNQMF